ncbi:TVP18 [[Candida] subhashii]|uniref:Golgi apparatus membrane protein TVP18 n=1 Tax=[Candida] subhashii TaxID=561895 RepID=A0A8J5R771_9ASCO|nr:TVP18 [[Candida] subhashii]KAG7666085.1 TVP18 [[Candida] subhashii]
MALSVGTIFGNISGGLSSDFKKKNFSVYGQWIAIITIFLCLALGVANIFHFNLVIIFSIICIVQGLIVVFVEMPFLLKICPLTDTFVNFVKRFDDNLPRCGFYLLNGVIQWLSLTLQSTSLIVVAVFFTLASFCYAMAYFTHQEFMKSTLDVSGSSSGNQTDFEAQVGQHIVRNVL